MSNLIDMLIPMSEGGLYDCIVLHEMRPDSNNQFEILKCRAIIRRIRCADGVFRWAAHGLMGGRTGSGAYGDLDQTVAFAEKWYPSDGKTSMWIGVDYCDPVFPINLIPM